MKKIKVEYIIVILYFALLKIIFPFDNWDRKSLEFIIVYSILVFVGYLLIFFIGEIIKKNFKKK